MIPYLVITQLIYLASLFPWFAIWGLSLMSFDAGFNLANISFVLTISLYPVAVIICSIQAWIFRQTKRKLAVIVNIIPMLWPLAFLGFMWSYS